MSPHLDQPNRMAAGAHYPELDGLRGIAIGLILLFHSRYIVNPQHTFEIIHYNLVSNGWFGVDLFFVISGFLITRILINSAHSDQYYRKFYIRRALRIFPVYYAVLVVVLAYNLFSMSGVQASYWFYLQNYLRLIGSVPIHYLDHLWSLAVEEQFYLMWPATMLYAVRRGAAANICLAVIFSAVVIRVLLVASGIDGVYFNTFARMDTLAMGAYVAIVLNDTGSLEKLRRFAVPVALASCAFILLMTDSHGPFSDVLVFSLFPLGVIFSCGLVLAIAADEQCHYRRALRNETLRALGKISYGVYLFHWPVIVFLQHNWGQTNGNYWLTQFAFLAVASAISIGLAWLSFRFFEGPILRMKHRLAPI